MATLPIMLGAIQVLHNADGGGGGGFVRFSRKKCYEGVRFNAISVTRGWMGVHFPGKKHYITFEWPLEASTVNNTLHNVMAACDN